MNQRTLLYNGILLITLSQKTGGEASFFPQLIIDSNKMADHNSTSSNCNYCFSQQLTKFWLHLQFAVIQILDFRLQCEQAPSIKLYCNTSDHNHGNAKESYEGFSVRLSLPTLQSQAATNQQRDTINNYRQGNVVHNVRMTARIFFI